MNFDISYNYSIFTFSPIPYCKDMIYINQSVYTGVDLRW